MNIVSFEFLGFVAVIVPVREGVKIKAVWAIGFPGEHGDGLLGVLPGGMARCGEGAQLVDFAFPVQVEILHVHGVFPVVLIVGIIGVISFYQ